MKELLFSSYPDRKILLPTHTDDKTHITGEPEQILENPQLRKISFDGVSIIYTKLYETIGLDWHSQQTHFTALDKYKNQINQGLTAENDAERTSALTDGKNLLHQATQRYLEQQPRRSILPKQETLVFYKRPNKK